MHIKTASDYAVRVMLYLLIQDRVCSAQEISKGIGIDRTSIVQIAKNLRKSDLITSVRGAQGGYTLIRCSEKLTLRDIVESFEDATSISHQSPDELEERDIRQITIGSDTVLVNYESFYDRLGKALEIPLRELLESPELYEKG